MKLLKDCPALIFEELDPNQVSHVKLGSLSAEAVGDPQQLPFIRKWHVILASPAQVYVTKNAHQVGASAIR